jgi:hypothetical protein
VATLIPLWIITDTFANTIKCDITSTTPKRVKVVGGGYQDTSATVQPIKYIIQQEMFTNSFKLLQLKGHDIVLGCDWIKRHNPIGLDLRTESRTLTIMKDGITKTIIQDFTASVKSSFINTQQLEKICKWNILGYVVQINLLQATQPVSPETL